MNVDLERLNQIVQQANALVQMAKPLAGPLAEHSQHIASTSSRLHDPTTRADTTRELFGAAVGFAAQTLNARNQTQGTQPQKDMAKNDETLEVVDGSDEQEGLRESIHPIVNISSQPQHSSFDADEIARTATGFIGVATPSGMVIAASGQVVDKLVEFGKFAEEQETLREDIRKERDVAIHKISAARDTMLKYLEYTFDERRSALETMFKTLDTAQQNNNLEQMQLALAGILTTVQSSPFKNLADFNKKYDDPEFILEM